MFGFALSLSSFVLFSFPEKERESYGCSFKLAFEDQVRFPDQRIQEETTGSDRRHQWRWPRTAQADQVPRSPRRRWPDLRFRERQDLSPGLPFFLLMCFDLRSRSLVACCLAYEKRKCGDLVGTACKTCCLGLGLLYFKLPLMCSCFARVWLSQCRQKTMDFVASCKNEKAGKRCSLCVCHKCLLNRFGFGVE